MVTAPNASVVSADRAEATEAAVVAALNAAAQRIESLTRGPQPDGYRNRTSDCINIEVEQVEE